MLARGLFVALFLCSASAADWPQWRGLNRDGHAPGPRLDKLPESPKTIWNIKAGPGLASPVVAGRFVIHFDAVDGKETIHALDRQTGKESWQRSIDETFHDMQGPDGPRCTPIVNDGRVYAVSCRGRLVCMQLEDGRELWAASATAITAPLSSSVTAFTPAPAARTAPL